MSGKYGVALWLIAMLWSSSAVSHPLFGLTNTCPMGDTQTEGTPAARASCTGLARVQRLLGSPEESSRIAGYLLVRARGDAAAWQLLAEGVAQSRFERTPAEDLALARVVTSKVQEPTIRPSVTHLAYATSARFDPAQPLRLLAMQTCLLALAWSKSPEALADLARMLNREGVLAESSIDALLSYPPEPFERLLAPTLTRSPAWARLLGLSKRAASIPILRNVLLEGSREMQLAAAEALLRLGDRAMDPLVERWLGDPTTPEEFRQIARGRVLDATAEILKHQDPTHGTSLLCTGLVHERVRRATETHWLLVLAHTDSACAPLAAEVLATRDGVELRQVLRPLLWAPNPLMRAAVARGLAQSLDRSAAGLLVARFAVEDEVRVRRAIVRALALRRSGLGTQLLRDAARFDPDPLVRQFATLRSSDESSETPARDPLGFGLGASGVNAYQCCKPFCPMTAPGDGVMEGEPWQRPNPAPSSIPQKRPRVTSR